MSVLLRAEDVTRTLTGEVPVTLVAGANLEVERGEFVVIAGPSGSGKSSLLYLLGLLDRPTSGRIFLNGLDTSQVDAEQLADLRLRQLGFVFQFHFLLPEFTVLENVMLPMRQLGQRSPTEMKARAMELLVELGLETQQHKLPKQISGGQAQRVAIARALANDPQLILADEPTGNLDSASSAIVQNLLQAVAGTQDRSVVAVTHDTDFADRADRKITIIDGRIFSGATKSVDEERTPTS